MRDLICGRLLANQKLGDSKRGRLSHWRLRLSFYIPSIQRLGLGGWSWGPRHLLPILPGLVALTGVLSNGWRKVLVLSAILGFLLTAPNLVSFYSPLLCRGQ